jgi:hypothetical protein
LRVLWHGCKDLAEWSNLSGRQGGREEKLDTPHLKAPATNGGTDFRPRHMPATEHAAVAHREAPSSQLFASVQLLPGRRKNWRIKPSWWALECLPIIDKADKIEHGPHDDAPFSAFVYCFALASSKDQSIFMPPLTSCGAPQETQNLLPGC